MEPRRPQIGRVDRKGSLWEQRAKKWLADGAWGEPPFVEVRQLIFVYGSLLTSAKSLPVVPKCADWL
jgi:hypothetical protein